MASIKRTLNSYSNILELLMHILGILMSVLRNFFDAVKASPQRFDRIFRLQESLAEIYGITSK